MSEHPVEVDLAFEPAGAAVDASSSDRYAFLSQRAAEFLRGQGGAASEDALIAHVFGSAGSAALWRPLLRQFLGDDDGLTLRADGYWALAEAPPTDEQTLLTDFVALDVETTGLRPLHQRVTELAAIRYAGGVEIARFESLCNPEKRIPKYIANLTGITDADVADAPVFAALADGVVEFIGSSLVVGHNVGFDLSFVNAELKRLGRPPLINERLDVMGLAMRLLPGLRRPSLDKVALALGLNPRHIHRAGIDAGLAAAAALRLAAEARAQGMTEIARLKATAALATRRPKDDLGRGRAVLDRSLLADIPKAPGVYIMRDAFDHVIYVGKAKNLRDRVASYYSQPLGYTRKMDGLLESMVKIDVEVAGSELEALLLESQLIKRYQPRYNTALRAFEHYPFIRVDISNPWPRVTLAKARKEDGARYFGPFRNKNGARKTVDVINSVIPLRTCPRSFKDSRSYGKPCIQLDLGRCLGPCVGRADRDLYMSMVHDVVDFLDGRDEVLYERLWQGLEEAAANLDFERAARLRNDLRHVQQVVSDHQRLREAAETHNLLLVLPSADASSREVLLVVGGRLWAQYRVPRESGETELAERLAASWDRLLARPPSPLDHHAVDEANILSRWLYRNAGLPAILPLDPPPSEPDWTVLAVRALALSDEDLVFEVRGSELDGGDGGESIVE